MRLHLSYMSALCGSAPAEWSGSGIRALFDALGVVLPYVSRRSLGVWSLDAGRGGDSGLDD